MYIHCVCYIRLMAVKLRYMQRRREMSFSREVLTSICFVIAVRMKNALPLTDQHDQQTGKGIYCNLFLTPGLR